MKFHKLKLFYLATHNKINGLIKTVSPLDFYRNSKR